MTPSKRTMLTVWLLAPSCLRARNTQGNVAASSLNAPAASTNRGTTPLDSSAFTFS